MMNSVNAIAPGKIILFGEHAINRGQPALAAAVGLYAKCTLQEADGFIFRSGTHVENTTRKAILEVAKRVDKYRRTESYEEIRKLAAADYFAPQKYILGAFGPKMPKGLEITWESELPSSSGLGSGGAAFVAMITALDCIDAKAAQLGDIVAHGGVASGLDTQTSIHGGVIRFSADDGARQTHCAPGLSIVIGNTKVHAATSEVNSRVRTWLAEKPRARMHYFEAIGGLTRAAVPLLERGDWNELGRLFNLNQLVLEKLGVSCPEIGRLIGASLEAGALGAKLSGSGGGGIIIALTPPKKKKDVAEAIKAAGGEALTPEIGVPGAHISL